MADQYVARKKLRDGGRPEKPQIYARLRKGKFWGQQIPNFRPQSPAMNENQSHAAALDA